MHEPEDPGANTAMFRAYVEHGQRQVPPPAASRAPWIAAGVALVAVVVVAVVAFVALG
jgi:hypothetical protein